MNALFDVEGCGLLVSIWDDGSNREQFRTTDVDRLQRIVGNYREELID